MTDKLQKVFKDLQDTLERHQGDLKLSFGLEYSCIIDWVADLTPRKNHPKARQYGTVWRGQGTSPEEAIQRVLAVFYDERGGPDCPHFAGKVCTDVQQRASCTAPLACGFAEEATRD